MASMYLLGNPDHYTSHSFANFYWRSFVNEVMRTCSTNLEAVKEIPENYVAITKGLTASSPVYDYIYRPLKYSNMTLYDWVQQFERRKGGTKQIDKMVREVGKHDESGENNGYEDAVMELDEKTDAGQKRKINIENTSTILVDHSDMFLEGHPQRQTQQPHLLSYKEYSLRVPNFMGGSLPRRDTGDAENYAATMLTLFKPWRSGMDLKPETQNWSEVFHKYTFSDKFLQLMDNFNLRYECSDARDDFAAQRKVLAKEGKKYGKHAI